jgi:hypothetical protein
MALILLSMSAIDTQSATQFLAKNKQAVLAANQSATRSLPQSQIISYVIKYNISICESIAINDQKLCWSSFEP